MSINSGKTENGAQVRFLWESDDAQGALSNGLYFAGKYLDSFCEAGNQGPVLYMGCGKREELEALGIREIMAVVSKKCREWHIAACNIELETFCESFGALAVTQAVLGLLLGPYTYSLKAFLARQGTSAETPDEDAPVCDFFLSCGSALSVEEQDRLTLEAKELADGILFARDMTNTPGNRLRPGDFAEYLCKFAEDAGVQSQILSFRELKDMGMEGLCGIGGSSDYPPCMVIMRYRGKPDCEEILGLFGKGVTCDTGGYCLKSSKSMDGIKGDMGGAAAVAGAVHAAARLKLPVNVTALMPICENRISASALLPGDVITAYGGKTVEILNTDAEGRLILADAIGYGIRNERVSAVVDIATLTGAVWSALGYTIAGALCNDDALYASFENGLKFSLERFLRFPYGKEHLKLLKSNVADIKNLGGDCCGTITAGVFLKEFAEGKPWLHLDIAGTAWSDKPQYAFEHCGATGAGVTSLYYLMQEWNR